MNSVTGPKVFAVNLDGQGQGPGLFAALILGRVKRRVDSQYGVGGQFPIVSEIGAITKDPNPDCLGAWGFEARLTKPVYSIKLAPMIFVFRDGSSPLHMDFEDARGWQTPESERLVGYTMQCVDRELATFFQFPPGRHWFRTYGEWRHGVFFDG